MNSDYDYDAAVKLCEAIAARVDPPRFYRERNKEVDRSRKGLEEDPIVRRCISIIEEMDTPYGHGSSHARAVAIDAGAIILIDGHDMTDGNTMEEMLHRAHLAGVLHDIKRTHPDHAREGARAADMILKDFGMSPQKRRAITRAIGNHEAFKPVRSLDDPQEQILSDALYDADKFRWGPDNFTTMLWDIIIPRDIALSKVMDRFPAGIEGIKKIRTTFRSRTGMEYGPDFIDKGLYIGELFYEEMKKRLPLSGRR